MILKRENGYSISYKENIPKDAKNIIIAMHGFAGDKESSCINLLEDKVNEMGYGLVRFDWPAHGESEVDGDKLTIRNCLLDLDFVLSNIKSRFPTSKIIAFSTSFGGYITLLYNYFNCYNFDHIILRSPAIKMYNVIQEKIMDDKLKNELINNKCFYYGFDRKIKINDIFIEELKNNNLIELYGNEKLSNVSIIHGTDDDIVSIRDSYDFSITHGCDLFPILGADHRYKKEGELDAVINTSLSILSGIGNTKMK